MTETPASWATSDMVGFPGTAPGSVVVGGSEAGEPLDGRHRVVGAGQRRQPGGEPVADAVAGPGHPAQHLVHPPPVLREPDERRPVVGDPAVGDVATEDPVLDAVLLDRRPGYVGARRH